MRSGLGPAASLSALGIAVVSDLPEVGQNFMDHPILRASIRLKPQHACRDPDQRHTNCCVTYTSGLGGGGFRDMILIGFNHRGLGEAGLPTGNGAVGGALFNTFSRGEVRLVSADPDVDPAVEENMLEDPRDLLRMRDVVRRLAVLSAHPAMNAISDSITFAETGLSLHEAASLPPDALDALMLQEAADTQHAAGSCRMTAYENPRGVVNPDLSVKGIAGLRVADASIMPADCRANTHFTCVMIGLMAASRIAAAEKSAR
jgi:5-(hydroxymethyl)furfural/furfural oxidase